MKLAQNPADRQAVLWLADGLTEQGKTQEVMQRLQPFLDKLAGEPTQHEEYVEGYLRKPSLISTGG